MVRTTYDPPSYRNYVRMSKHRHVLVEGSSDKRALEILLDALYDAREQKVNRSHIVFDTAESLIGSPDQTAAGNRARVEHIAESILGTPYETRFAAFVDREFREFITDGELVDLLSCHRVQGRMVWSRGHSIENYFFDYNILKPALRAVCSNDHYRQALKLYRKVFESALRLAASLSLVAYHHRIPNKQIESSIDWKIFRVDSTSTPNSVILDYKAWLISLKEKGIDPVAISDALQVWQEKCSSLDPNVARWISHGHIGFKTMWAVFCTIIYMTHLSNGLSEGQAESAAQDALRFNSNRRFNLTVENWVGKAIGEGFDHPRELFWLLQLESPS